MVSIGDKYSVETNELLPIRTVTMKNLLNFGLTYRTEQESKIGMSDVGQTDTDRQRHTFPLSSGTGLILEDILPFIFRYG